MEWIYDDGGRSKYFKAEQVGDCVTRAISIATGKDYLDVYNGLNDLAKNESARRIKKHKNNKRSSSRNGVFKETYIKYLSDLGWTRHSTCHFGKGVECHLNEYELPKGTLIVEIAKHLVCVIDGIIHDTYNSSIKEYLDLDGNLNIKTNRAVYAYWTLDQNEIRDNKEFIWKVTVNGDIKTAYFIAASNRKEAIEKVNYRTGAIYNCATIEEDL